MRSGTTRAQQRMMAKLFSARSGTEFPVQPDGPLGRAPAMKTVRAYLAVLGLLSIVFLLLLAMRLFG